MKHCRAACMNMQPEEAMWTLIVDPADTRKYLVDRRF